MENVAYDKLRDSLMGWGVLVWTEEYIGESGSSGGVIFLGSGTLASEEC